MAHSRNDARVPHPRLASSDRRVRTVMTFGLALAAAVMALGVLLTPKTAFADGAGPIVVAQFEGAKKQSLRDLVVNVLREAGYDVASTSDVPDANAGESEFVEAAKKGGYRAFVLGNTELDKKSWVTSISIREGKTGKIMTSVVIESGWYPGLQKALKQRLVSRVSGPLDTAQAPAKESSKPAPVVLEEEKPKPAKAKEEPEEEAEPEAKEEEPEKEAEPEAEDEPEPAEPEDKPNYSKPKGEQFNNLELDAGPMFVQRAWVISDSLSGTLDGPVSPTHDVSMMGLKLGAAIYPLGFTTKSFARHIGIEGTFSRSLYGETPLLDPQGADDGRETVFQEYTVSLRLRIPAGPAQIGLFGGVGGTSLTLEGEKVVAALPDVDYGYFRGGADLSFAFNKSLSAKLGFAYRGTYTLGKDPRQIQGPEWFPKARGKAFDLALQADYAFSKQWGMRVGGFMSRYAMAFNPEVTSIRIAARGNDPAPPIAGGAVDLYAGGTLSLVLTLQ